LRGLPPFRVEAVPVRKTGRGTDTAVDRRNQSLLPTHAVQVGITKIFLGQEITGVQLSGCTKFFDRAVPVVPKSIGVAEIGSW